MPRTATAADHLRGLNPAQRRAVKHADGPLLILAGAGSGKTRTLVHRIVHLIRSRGVEPQRIGVVTFTNRAADEMQERIRSFAGEDARRVTVSTFHALGVRILREHGRRAGLPARFAIYAAGDQLAALRTACDEVRIDDDRFDLKRVARRISDWKQKRLSPAAVRAAMGGGTHGPGRSDAFVRRDDYDILAADAYPRYEEVLRSCGAVDFDDLLLLPVRLLDEHEEVRQDVWRRWHYWMIDEYQDTNPVQLELARHLAGTRRNLCVVGDDDQSIYAFRGAEVGNILDFEHHFPGCATVTLEENYRSTRRILETANAVIAGNRHRHPKRLRTSNGIGEPVTLVVHEDDAAEADAVARAILARRIAARARWEDFAVLYRANTQARPLEEACRAANIPYRVVGGTSFFERREVMDGIAYLRAVAHPRDEIALRRVLNYPPRGIGRTTVLRLADEAHRRAVAFVDVLPDAAAVAGAGQALAIREFLGMLADHAVALADAEREATRPPPTGELPPIAAWAHALFAHVGLEDAIRAENRDNPKVAEARVANLRDLAGSLARFERRRWAERQDDTLSAHDPEWQPPTLREALTRIALDAEDGDEDESGRVVLMTLHSAKGLEFDEVFLVGLEEEIIPHARSLIDSDGAGALLGSAGDPLAEERRLLYVGMTRARRRLTLSRCRRRKRGGQSVETLPSRFLEEIPADLLELRGNGSPERSAEENAAIRSNFFASMRDMLADRADD
jgi:DNA helicase II / ATP-dependent DNA helicase PcrA